jgi:hypothetical protein
MLRPLASTSRRGSPVEAAKSRLSLRTRGASISGGMHGFPASFPRIAGFYKKETGMYNTAKADMHNLETREKEEHTHGEF